MIRLVFLVLCCCLRAVHSDRLNVEHLPCRLNTKGLSFVKASVAGTPRTFWLVDGEQVTGKYGEPPYSITHWFNTVERSAMVVCNHIFSALETPSRHTMLDIGSHQGWFSLVAGAYGLRAIAFDMQKYCVDLFRCSASLNGYWYHRIYNAYVTNTERAKNGSSIRVCEDSCSGGTSPYNRGPKKRQISVNPLDITTFLSARVLNIALVKLDVEGYEPIVLDGLMSLPKVALARIANLIIEITPGRWREYGLSFDQGFAPFASLFRESFRAMHLPELREGNFSLRVPGATGGLRFDNASALSRHVASIRELEFKNYWFFRSG